MAGIGELDCSEVVHDFIAYDSLQDLRDHGGVTNDLLIAQLSLTPFSVYGYNQCRFLILRRFCQSERQI